MTDPTDADDAGLSLIELIIYMLLASVLLGAMATILINSWSTQQDVQTTTQATNKGQLVGQSIERAVRNAEAFDVSPDGTMLRVHTTLGGERECQAFWITGGAAYMTNSGGPLPGATTSSWPAPWVPADVVQYGSTAFFAQNDLTVTYTFDIETESAPVRFHGDVSMRTPTMGATTPCWS